MKASKEQVVGAVLIIGEYLGMKPVASVLLDVTDIQTTIKELLVMSLIKDQLNYLKYEDKKLTESFMLIRAYSYEMFVNKQVIFNEK